MMDEKIYNFAKKRKLLNCDESVIDYIYKNIDIPFDIWVNKKLPRSKNVYCEINCKSCKNISRINTKHLYKRSTLRDEICLKCGGREVRKMEEYRKRNSDAQKIAQNKPEQKLKNANAVSKFWSENPEVKEVVRQKILKLYDNPKYKERVMNSRGKSQFSLSGRFLFRGESWVEFGSAYELSFLIWAAKNKDVTLIRRCKFYINYIYENRSRSYYPDFFIIMNNQKSIVEIKSIKNPFFDSNRNNIKCAAAQDFVKKMNYDSYLFIDEDESIKLGISLKRTSAIKKVCKQLSSEGLLELSSRHINKYIGCINENKKQKTS
jgi:hypothetical protein